MSTKRVSDKQRHILEFISQHPGSCAMDAVRACYGGRGHWAEYSRISRLLARGLLVRGPSTNKGSQAKGLYLPEQLSKT